MVIIGVPELPFSFGYSWNVSYFQDVSPENTKLKTPINLRGFEVKGKPRESLINNKQIHNFVQQGCELPFSSLSHNLPQRRIAFCLTEQLWEAEDQDN